MLGEIEQLGFELRMNASDVKTMFPSYNRLCFLERERKRHMVKYYIFGESDIQDFEYDALAQEYDHLCEQWGINSPLTGMVGADLTHPCLHKTYFDLTGIWPCA